MDNKSPNFYFGNLVGAIRQVDDNLTAQAGRAVNISLTMRNWLIGVYIHEYELRGADRANYGDNLLIKLSQELKRHKISNCGRRQLYNYLTFYRSYPQIVRTVSAQARHLLPNTIDRQKVRTLSAQSVPLEKLLGSLSYSHFELLIVFEFLGIKPVEVMGENQTLKTPCLITCRNF